MSNLYTCFLIELYMLIIMLCKLKNIMATWTAMYINNSNLKKTIEKFKGLTNLNNITKSKFPNDLHKRYLSDINAKPNYIIIGQLQNNWITIRHNSFNKLTDWNKFLSKHLECKVIVTIAQSVSDAYYFAQYENGILNREIEVCYSEDFKEINFGEKYNFENDRPGKSEEIDGKTEYIFDFESIEYYCKQFELKLQCEYDKIEWSVLQNKQWWKFW